MSGSNKTYTKMFSEPEKKTSLTLHDVSLKINPNQRDV